MENAPYDEPPPEQPGDGSLLVRIFVPELNVYKCLQFPSDKLIWDVKQQCLASLPKELKESFNYGLFCPPSNGKAGKFLDEERRLGDYPFNGPVGYLELKYKRRVYKMLNLDERQLKALHTRANLRRFLECINGGHVEKIAKMCAKGLDPNFHCQETGETPLTIATGTKKPNKLLIALVNGGAILDYRTRDGSTALHRAVERDSLEAVSTLLELGASPNYRDTKGLTPVYLSVTKKSDPKICEILLHDHATLGIQDNQGWQEVHQACRNGLVHHLEHLLFYGANMDGHNASGNTPLHVCAVNNQEACARMLLFRGSQRDALNYANQTPYQVAVIAGNLELAEMIQNYKSEDIVPFRGPPRYNPRRRSGLGWGTTLSRVCGPPSPCPSEHPFSSASSSMSEGSSSHRSHEDNISIVTDKSLGDTSDIISDSSGVGTNPDSAACSIGHPSTTVVCMEAYTGQLSGHIQIQPGDVIEVVGSTDCGLLEGFVRGIHTTGFFPAHCVQEVQFRQKSIMSVSTSTPVRNNYQPHETNEQPIMHQQQQYSSQTAPRIKKQTSTEARTVVLHKAKRGFGFILRGAKASSPLMQLKPSPRCPALQYLDDVDPGGVADLAGLRPGDFLLSINGEDVACASHEHVVDLIRKSGSLVKMTVITIPQNPNIDIESQHSHPSSGMSTPTIITRQCATLPRRMNSGPGGKPAPLPPRRDPKTTLSVGRARAKSMVAGLEGGGEKDDDDILNHVKSSSVESVHQQSHSSTPTQGTPIQPRTASIKSRPTSSRITAAELEELFQRQHCLSGFHPDSLGYRGGNTGVMVIGADGNRCSTLMTSSRFQSGLDSGAATPPISPQKGPLVYASVAEMKRKKTKTGSTMIKGRPCQVPQINSELKRTFHSTPDLAAFANQNSNLSSTMTSSVSWYNTVGHKGHRSQDDIHVQRLNLPPPNHPPPPPPGARTERFSELGQVVKVEVTREYECLTTIQKKIAEQKNAKQMQDNEIMSSFKPASNAKLYASPQELKSVGYRIQPANNNTEVRKSASIRSNGSCSNQSNASSSISRNSNPYAQPGNVATQQQQAQYKATPINAPPIPDPDYSLSESDGEEDNSVRHVRTIKITNGEEKPKTSNGNGNGNGLAETSGNSNTSGSSTGSGTVSHSFSVDEIQKIRTKLKSSKSYPNDFLRQQNQHEEGDNSSSGVSSDQEITITNNVSPPIQHSSKIEINGDGIKSKDSKQMGTLILEQKKMVALIANTAPIIRNELDDNDDDQSPSPPSKGFQRHNSLTRKQAATLAASRAKANQTIHNRYAVTLAHLPPPIENQDEFDEANLPSPLENQIPENGLVLAPPPEFDDNLMNNDQQPTNINSCCKRVRIVGAVPKNNRLNSQ